MPAEANNMADIERSFLDAKERDEVVAIASALGIKPSPRAKKETVIDQIMKVTGADAETAAPAAKKPAGRKPKAEKAPEGDSGTSVSVAPNAPTAAPSAERENNDRAERPARNDRNDRPNRNGPPRGDRPDRNSRPRPAAALFDPFADTANDSGSGYDPAEDEWAFAAAKPAGESGSNGGGEVKTVATPADLRDDTDAAGSPATDEGFGGGRRNRRDRFRDRAEGGAPREPREGGQPQGDRPDRPDRGPRNDQGDRPDRPERQDRPDRGPRPDRGDRPDRGPRPDRSGGGEPGNRQFGGGQQGFDKGFDGDGRNKRRRRGRDRDRQVTAGQDAVADRISETYTGELIEIDGFLDLADQGYGYIRAKGYLPSPGDVYVPVNKVKQLGLRRGDKVVGRHRPATAQEKFPAIVEVDTVNGHNVEVARLRPKFEDLTPLFPDVKLRLEEPGQSGNMVSRIIDLVAPIGKGQRGLIVSPPKAGKTTIMKQIAASIETNNPTVHLMVLLIDERPEEVTDMRRHVKGEVVASTFDKPSDEHTMVAELALERAKRLVEEGRDVIIILDGITRLARAYNLAAPATGRIMSGGIDTGALYPPKKFFGAARNIEEGGSLTILATALIETGSTMDTVIFEEFKGTGNMELRLDRRLAEKRIYPAINVNESSTRHEELLFDKVELETIWKLRRVLNGLAEDGTAAKALELLMDRIKTTRTNAEFLAEIAKAPGVH
jgi:transcription termination factor Rho